LSEPGRPPRSLADHRRIAEAIRRQDPRAAEVAMRRHLKVVADTRLLRWSPGELDAATDGDEPD
jgi:GntR family transcriptional repressor for pyruvate dehydrogenase complex